MQMDQVPGEGCKDQGVLVGIKIHLTMVADIILTIMLLILVIFAIVGAVTTILVLMTIQDEREREFDKQEKSDK